MNSERMKKGERLPRKWAFIFLSVAVAALVVSVAAFMREEWIIGGACAFVSGVQFLNFIKWKLQR